MSEYVKVNGIAGLKRALERGQKNIKKGIESALWKTAQQAVRPIRRRVPVAFGELRNSIQAFPRGANGNPVTSVDAPHAGAVEIGSQPHTPNFEKLLAWVKLRGLQGLTKQGNLRAPRAFAALRKNGPTSAHQAKRVSMMLIAQNIGNRYSKKGQKRFEDAALQVARAISKSIEKHGTEPHWFVQNSLQDIRKILAVEIRKGLDKATRASSSTMSVKSGEMTDEAGSAVTWTPTMRVKDSELF